PVNNHIRPTGGAVNGDVLKCAMLLHAGLTAAAEAEYGEHVCQRAADLRVRSVEDWCDRAMRAAGKDAPRGRDELIKAASSPMLTAAGPSTISLPMALGNVAEKSLLEGFNIPAKTWASWARKRPVRNFKDHTSLRP